MNTAFHSCFTMAAAAAIAAGITLNAAEPGAAPFGCKAGYPGPLPGRAVITCEGPRIKAGNAALAASWTWTQAGLKRRSLADLQSKEQCAITSEVFQIVLKNGERHAASALAAEGRPRVSELAPRLGASRLADRIPGRQVELTLHSRDGRLRVVWRAIAHDDGNYVREEIDLEADKEAIGIREVVWLDEVLPGVRAAGVVNGSPLTLGHFFLGADDPMATNGVDGSGKATCRLSLNQTLHRGEKLTRSFVLGVAPEGQTRRAFLYYLERERAHPYRPFLHYNSWYDISWQAHALSEANCLEAIRLLGEKFIKPYGVVLNAVVFDDVWDDPRTLWQFHHGFPRGFTPLAALCKKYHTRLGVWLSPFGGYGAPREERLRFGRQQGY
ncbi:MAG: hypothetical protein ACP5XB_01640, partial [Isosphaeraceae bacterium]